MDLAEAPFHADIAPGPAGARAFWTQAEDGPRIRLGLWEAPGARGTVFLFPGRTEYIEKYADTARGLHDRGLTTFAIDWRGQGLADRLIANPRIGHVERFTDYQKDVAAMCAAARELELPEPWFLLAHSMGGCIGLRALIEGMPVQSTAFTGPMWGIRIAPALRPLAYILKHLMPAIGLGHGTPPTTIPEPYVLNAEFDGNVLTKDPEMWDMMRNQIARHPDLSLGGPSYVWLREAIDDCNWLARQPSPNIPCLSFLGTDERIVHVQRIHDRMAQWPKGKLEIVQDAEHEVLMEGPGIRQNAFDAIARHFLNRTPDGTQP